MCQTSNYCRIQKLTLQFGHRLQFIGKRFVFDISLASQRQQKSQNSRQPTFFLHLIETESLFHSEMRHTAAYAMNEFILWRKCVLPFEVQKLQIEIQSERKEIKSAFEELWPKNWQVQYVRYEFGPIEIQVYNALRQNETNRNVIRNAEIMVVENRIFS